ncbi:hypothetical protein ACFX13_013805 [Malus domestica]
MSLRQVASSFMMEIAKRHLNVTIPSTTRDPQALREPTMVSAQNESSSRLLSASEDDGVLEADVVVDNPADDMGALVREVDDDTELAAGSGGGGESGDEGSLGGGF